jgi:hypothetical protein
MPMNIIATEGVGVVQMYKFSVKKILTASIDAIRIICIRIYIRIALILNAPLLENRLTATYIL